MGTSGDYPPFSDWGENVEHPAGFSVDVAEAFARARSESARANGVTPSLQWVRFRWSALSQDLESDRFDLALSGVTVRPDRSTHGRFSLPIATSGMIVLVPEDSPIHDAEDLDQAGIRLAVNAGGHLERTARALFPGAEIEAISQNGAVLGQLAEPAIEAVVTDTLEAPIWMRSRPGLRAIGPLTQDRKAAWFPIGQEALVRDFDRFLLQAEADGRLGTWRRRSGLPAAATAAPRAALLARLDERLSLMNDVADAKQVLKRPVEDLTREAQVLDAAVSSLREIRSSLPETQSGTSASPPLEESAVRALYQAQIEAAKWIQRTRLAEGADPAVGLSRANGAGGREAESDLDARGRAEHELNQRLRPALIFLGERIAALLVEVERDTPGAGAEPRDAIPSRFTLTEVSRALQRHALPQSHLEALTKALNGLFPQPHTR